MRSTDRRSADLATARSTRALCEQQLLELTKSGTLSARVEQLVLAADGGVCKPRELARQLGMSERTLKRRLAEQKTSYTALLERARHTRVLELLRTDMSVEEVSQRIGYSDAANFTRAFRRWTGHCPHRSRHAAPRRVPS